MSTPPKEPKPDEARRGGNLESTFLGVAPTAPEQVPAPAAAPVAGSAIIATPMISVSDRGQRSNAAAAEPAAAARAQSPQGAAVAPAAAPARPAGLQGGWQSEGIPRALGPEQTALHGSPAWPMPPQQAAQPQPAPAQPATAPPRPAEPNAAPAAGLQHTALASDYLRDARDAALGTPPAAPQRPLAVQPVAADIGRQTAYSPPAAPARPHWQESAAQTLAPGIEVNLAAAPESAAAAGAATGGPAAGGPVGGPAGGAPAARAFDAGGTVVSGPVAGGADAGGTVVSGAVIGGPAAGALAAGGSASTGPASPPPASPPTTQGPPPTAELSSPAPIPLPVASAEPVQVRHAEPEPGVGPRSMGTQASVAPPLGDLDSSFHGPMAAAIQQATPAAPGAGARPAPVTQVTSPVRNAVPQALLGTVIDRTPSIPAGGMQGGPPPPANPTLRFEQVPPPRSSLAQQATLGLHIPIDHNVTQWGKPAHDGKTKAMSPPKGKAPSQWRMVVLAFLALLSVVFAAFGPELRDLAMAELQRRKAGPAGAPLAPTAAAQATLTNLPGPGPGTPSSGSGEPAVIAGSGSPATSNPAAAAAPAPAMPAVEAAAIAPAAVVPSPGAMEPAAAATAAPEPGARNQRRKVKGRDASAGAAPAASAESQLAAEAGRHVLAARFAEALPLYRALQREYPHNTVYAAMTKVLEQKLDSAAAGAQP